MTKILLTIAALGSGIIGGTFFAFSTFIMASFAEISNESGVSAMNAINRVILRSPFMPVFVGTVILAAVLVVIAIRNWEFGASSLIIAGAVLYILASFVSTIVFNVPLNDRLATFDGKSAESAAFWTVYLRDWTAWNHVRTVASLAASAAFIWALAIAK
jgi:uncharacterized membrane protein